MWEFFETEGFTKRFYRKEMSPFRVIAVRLSVIIILLLVVAYIFWVFEGTHIKDEVDDGEFSYIDSLYFTIVSVTTVGYGDIVPITEEARMFDALIITPVRIIVWVLFIGTAYQLVVQNYWERYRMSQARKKLKGHVIVAGFGTTGKAVVNELILNGYTEKNLVVIDSNEQDVKAAADKGATAILGDPTTEEILISGGIKTAGVLIISIPQDDTNVLITLTAKDLNKNLKVIARVALEENIKLLKRAGADVIISPSLTSGNLMAMAVGRSESVELIGDLLTTSRGVNVKQRKVSAGEAGKAPKSLQNKLVIGVIRGGKHIGPKELDGVTLRAGDDIILID